MGLFTKKEACAICGGKVSGLFPAKIEGHLICKECYGFTDLPDNMEKNMTVDDFKMYREFREENKQLKSDFVVSRKVEFGLFGTKLVVDFEHGRFSFDPNLDRTIFLGSQLKSFTIKEDYALLYSASAEEVVHYQSKVPDRVEELVPRIDDYMRRREMHEMAARMARNNSGGRPDSPNQPPPPPPINLPKLIEKFNVELRFEHPYWGTKTFTVGAPDFDSHNPDVNDYLRQYNEKIELMDSFVQALVWVAFPDAPRREA